MIFDVLSYDNKDIRNTPFSNRITFLDKIFQGKQDNEIVKQSMRGNVKEMIERAKREDREGIIVKDLTAYYESGKRRDSWRKCKRWLETTIKVKKFEDNPSGIRVESDEGISCQIAGEQHREVKKQIESIGYAEIYVQYLEKTEDGMLRFPSYRGLVK
jgi:ATP-dependent RNA circularization protein (DNA/RNA ligase family)